MPHRGVDPDSRAFARSLRTTTTDAERLLWWGLRGRQLGGWRFRRQVPIGGFVVDFLCPRAGLAVELDGAEHDAVRDDRRDASLRAVGIDVLRFPNNEVFTHYGAVLDTILQELGRRAAR